MSSYAARLAKYSACDVSDALVAHGSADGGSLPNLVRRARLAPETVAGPAYTVLYAPLSDPRPAVAQLYIDAVPPHSVVVIGTTPELQLPHAPYVAVSNALYGGLMLARAQYLGAAALVVLGRVRDLAEHRALAFPVWLLGVGTTAPGSAVKVVAVNVPLSLKTQSGGLDVFPGDMIVADENGVVRIPSAVSLDLLLQYIPRRVRADEQVARDIARGRPAADAQKHHRANI